MEPLFELSYDFWLGEADDWLEASGVSGWLFEQDGSRRLRAPGTQIVLVLQGCA